VRLPRFRIAWVMSFIAIVALDLGAIRELPGVRFRAYIHGDHRLAFMISALILGALPMANVLAVSLLIGLRRRGSHPFLLGFETFGATALVSYIAGASLFTEKLVMPFFYLVIEHLEKPLMNGPHITPASQLIPCIVVIAILILPQLVFAMIGGSLFRHFRTR
jgi:hypothetical protein